MSADHTNWKDHLRVDGWRKTFCYEMFCFGLMSMQCSLLWPFWVASFIKGRVIQACFNLYAADAERKAQVTKNRKAHNFWDHFLAPFPPSWPKSALSRKITPTPLCDRLDYPLPFLSLAKIFIMTPCKIILMDWFWTLINPFIELFVCGTLFIYFSNRHKIKTVT